MSRSDYMVKSLFHIYPFLFRQRVPRSMSTIFFSFNLRVSIAIAPLLSSPLRFKRCRRSSRPPRPYSRFCTRLFPYYIPFLCKDLLHISGSSWIHWRKCSTTGNRTILELRLELESSGLTKISISVLALGPFFS